jgi:nicotinamidase-related amidase
MRVLRDQAVGLLVDVQERLFPHMHEKEHLLQRLTVLFEGLKVLGVPHLATEQYKRGLGETIPELADYAAAAVGGAESRGPIEKLAFSCFDDDAFAAALEQTGRKTVIIAGIESHVCVSQTSLDLLAAGYHPVVIADAVSSRKLIDKKTALARLRQAGATVTSVEAILFELCRVSRTDEFKAISALVK